MTYWINTVSADHVQRGVAGGFTQANHGKPYMLRKMARGDWIIFYSPKTALEQGESLQAFTAIGRVADDEPYQAVTGPAVAAQRWSSCPARRHPSGRCWTSWQFIVDPQRWGYKFRFGVFRIDEPDFLLIRSTMTQPLAA